MSDDVIWAIINHGFCSFKAKVGTRGRNGRGGAQQTFCRHPHSITGLCLRSACPLANSRYAVVREEQGKLFLYIKNAERSHLPSKLWQKITLSKGYAKGLQQITELLKLYPKYIQHRNKQRLTKIHQYLMRMRKLRLEERGSVKRVATNAKVEKREKRREGKALKAARVENAIEEELLERLKQGTYGDLYIPHKQFVSMVNKAEEDTEREEGKQKDDGEEEDGNEEEEDEWEREEEDEEEEDDDDVGAIEFVEAPEGFDDDEDDLDDIEDAFVDEDEDEEEEDEEEDDSDDDDSDEGDSDEEDEDEGDEDEDEPQPGQRKRKRGGLEKKGKLQQKKKKQKSRRKLARTLEGYVPPRVEVEYENEDETQRQLESHSDASLAF